MKICNSGNLTQNCAGMQVDCGGHTFCRIEVLISAQRQELIKMSLINHQCVMLLIFSKRMLLLLHLSQASEEICSVYQATTISSLKNYSLRIKDDLHYYTFGHNLINNISRTYVITKPNGCNHLNE